LNDITSVDTLLHNDIVYVENELKSSIDTKTILLTQELQDSEDDILNENV